MTTALAALACCNAAAAETVHILAFGQANMEGRFGPAPSYSAPDPRIRVWNWKEDRFETAQLGVFPFWRDQSGSGPANNLAYVFSQNLIRKCGGNVDLTLLAAGGMKIEYFLPAFILKKNRWTNAQSFPSFGGSLADELMGEKGDGRMALSASGASTYDIVLMEQGEADTGPADLYETQLGALFRELKYRKLTRNNTEIIVGETNPESSGAGEQEKALLKLQAPTLGLVPWDGADAFDTPGAARDKLATGEGLQTLGDRYFDEYLRLMGGNCPNGVTN